MSVFQILVVGIGACATFDFWQRIFHWLTRIPPSNWAIVGRWAVGLMTMGQLFARDIEAQSERKNELAVGWIVHYAVAVGYAAIYEFLMSVGVITIGIVDGLLFGLTSVLVPWLVFLPCLGKGVMARLTPNPLLACSLALMMHLLFGLSICLGFKLFEV